MSVIAVHVMGHNWFCGSNNIDYAFIVSQCNIVMWISSSEGMELIYVVFDLCGLM